MRRTVCLLSLIASSLAVAACGPEVLPELQHRDLPIAWGKPDPGHPEVGDLGGCSSTLIGRKTVLTAAHCVKSKTRVYTFKTLGSTYKSVSVKVHPDYDGDISNDADLAVVHLANKVLGVKPARLVPDKLVAGEKIVLVGFGLTDDQVTSGKKYFGENKIDVLSSMTFTFLNEKGAGACPGDSGGPSFVIRNGQERQAGIHSRGSYPPCGTLFGGAVDVRVDAFRPWITKQAGADLYDGSFIDTQAPKVTITSPADGAPVPRELVVKATASDNVAVTGAELWLNGTLQATVTGPGPFSIPLPGVHSNDHTLTVKVTDAEKNRAQASIKLTRRPQVGFGEACLGHDDCKSGHCLAGDAPMCSRGCSGGTPCPDGFSCGSEGYCEVEAEQGGCNLTPAAAATPPLALAIALALALAFRRRRAR